jgi:DNA repair ATPase RecN
MSYLNPDELLDQYESNKDKSIELDDAFASYQEKCSEAWLSDRDSIEFDTLEDYLESELQEILNSIAEVEESLESIQEQLDDAEIDY